MRFKLTLAYDGRTFAGWQSQPGGNTVQDTVEGAIGRILKTASPPRLHGSGRTDAGVHALGQTAHFDPPASCRMTAESWLRALNANLPSAVRILCCQEAPDGFHARFSATGKTYEYRIDTSQVFSPLEVGLAWHVPQKIDRKALEAARDLLSGRHDFAAFCAFRGDAEEREPGYAVRTIHRIDTQWLAQRLVLTFKGEGFLYKMVRMLTGSILRVGLGRDSLEWLLDLRNHAKGRKTPYAAPADGLYLLQVHYGEET